MRRVLRSAVSAAILLLTTTFLGAATPAPEAASVSYMFLELDNSVVGPLVACKVNFQDLSFTATKRSLSRVVGGLQYPEITFEIDASMGKPMYDWIKASVSGGGGGGAGGLRKSGAIIMADFDYKELARISFQNALITEVGMPKLDAASSAPAVISVTIEPESTSRTFPSRPNQLAKPRQKAWLCSNFRLKIDGLRLASDPPKIGALSLGVGPAPGGVMRLADLTVDPADLPYFTDWQMGLFCSGAPQASAERTCTVEYLDPDGAPLFTATLHGTGVVKLTPLDATPGAAPPYLVELYVEGWEFETEFTP